MATSPRRSLRVSAENWQRWQARSTARGLTVSAWIHSLAADDIAAAEQLATARAAALAAKIAAETAELPAEPAKIEQPADQEGGERGEEPAKAQESKPPSGEQADNQPEKRRLGRGGRR